MPSAFEFVVLIDAEMLDGLAKYSGQEARKLTHLGQWVEWVVPAKSAKLTQAQGE